MLAAIERFVSPQDPSRALELIVRFFEGDDDLPQDDLDNIASAFERAATLFWQIGRSCPADMVEGALKRLAMQDNDHPDFDEAAFNRMTKAGAKAWADVPDAAAWVREQRILPSAKAGDAAFASADFDALQSRRRRSSC